MRRIETSAYEVAARYIGVKEVPGSQSNPAVLAMLKLDNEWPEGDETPWCSAFVNWVCKQLGLSRSRSLLARSWLAVGESILLEDAEPGLDVVIFSRGASPQPGPADHHAPGHVGFFDHVDVNGVWVLGGNQGDEVSFSPYPKSRVLGVRRLVQV